MRKLLPAFAITCTLLAGSTALADDGFYAGIGGGVAWGESSPGGPGSTSAGTLPILGLTLGYRHDMSQYFVGGEVDADISLGGSLEYFGAACADGYAAAPYYCTHDATVRFRGIAGTDLKGIEVFATLGYGIMIGDGAIGPDGSSDRAISGGLTVGGGAQIDVGRGMVRAEYIYDNFRHSHEKASIYDPDWEAHTGKVTYIIGF